MCLGVSLVVRAAHIMDGVTVLHQLAHVNSRGLLSLTAAWGLWEERGVLVHNSAAKSTLWELYCPCKAI